MFPAQTEEGFGRKSMKSNRASVKRFDYLAHLENVLLMARSTEVIAAKSWLTDGALKLVNNRTIQQ